MGAMYNTDGELTDEGQESAASREPKDADTTDIDPGQRPSEHMTPFDGEYGEADESSADYSVEEQNPKESKTE